MHRVAWLFEDGPLNEHGEVNLLADEVKKQGHDAVWTKYIPFGGGDYKSLIPEDRPTVAMGSINLCRDIQRTCPWVPGPIANFPNYCCSTYYAHYGRWLLNQDYIFLPYGELVRRAHDLFKEFNPGIENKEKQTLFVRPDEGTKPWAGHLARRLDFSHNKGPLDGQYARPEDLVVVAAYKKLGREWRVVVGGDEILSGCQYIASGELDIKKGLPTLVREYVESILATRRNLWQPDYAYVMDIAEESDNGAELGLLELNSFSCSGLYAMDYPTVVDAISRHAWFEHGNYYDKAGN